MAHDLQAINTRGKGQQEEPAPQRARDSLGRWRNGSLPASVAR